jgi:hypothetical protein
MSAVGAFKQSNSQWQLSEQPVRFVNVIGKHRFPRTYRLDRYFNLEGAADTRFEVACGRVFAKGRNFP